MFDGQRFVTRGVHEGLPLEVQLLLWALIDGLKTKTELDYLQVFELTQVGDATADWNLQVVHRQEHPASSRTLRFSLSAPVDAKLFVIDDGTYTTMMLSSEY